MTLRNPKRKIRSEVWLQGCSARDRTPVRRSNTTNQCQEAI
ncbi:MAG: hypothetical protein JWM95_5184 [Gemmatimonadetes bacterium]|nr:hypothetical protein [Gemmatimonadota bacterium]